MRAGFFFLLLLTGGNTSDLQELPDDYNVSNHSFEEIPGGNTSVYEEPKYYSPAKFEQNFEEIPISGGNTSSLEHPDLHGGPRASNQSFEEIPGGNSSSIAPREPPEYLKEYFKSFAEMPEPGKKVCTYQDVLNYLNLTSNSDLFTMSRPVKNHSSLTYVYLEMVISAILDVRETDQTFISYVWIYMAWDNKHIRWDPEQFCGLKHLVVPTESLWKPDITIEEMIEKDKAPPSPYLIINSYGEVEYKNDQVVIATCKIRVYTFPFDIQRCNISFKSLMHTDKELYFVVNKNTSVVTKWSRSVMQTQYEWLFIKMTVSNKIDNFSIGANQTSTVYTIFMKRRSVLYIANFLVPVLFFLCLDLSSFLVSDHGGEKLSFKVTVLLAVTVMQLILKDILPCSSDRIPLIAVFCIGIFSLMMLSLVETILVMYLMEKDDETDRDRSLMEDKQGKASFSCFTEMKKCTDCASLYDVSADQSPSVIKEGSNCHLTEVSLALEKVSDELGEIEKSMSLLSSTKEGEKLGYWTRVAKKINKVFVTFYVTTAAVFLVVIFSLWSIPEEY